jgi:hypothetical protein
MLLYLKFDFNEFYTISLVVLCIEFNFIIYDSSNTVLESIIILIFHICIIVEVNKIGVKINLTTISPVCTCNYDEIKLFL